MIIPSTVSVSFVTTSLEGRALHLVLRVSVADALLLVDVPNGRQQRVILAQNQRMVEIPEHVPRYLLNLVARVNHVHTRLDAILHLDGQLSRVAVEILSLSLKTVETVCILQIECCDTSHNKLRF